MTAYHFIFVNLNMDKLSYLKVEYNIIDKIIIMKNYLNKKLDILINV